jgi:UDPglucose 6-dehydrogenase
MSDSTVSVFGLGKVGITLSAALAGAGYKVVGVDVVEPLVRSLQEGRFSTGEPGVMERLAPAMRSGQFRATMHPGEAVLATSASFIIVPTPSNTLNGFSNRYILNALEQIGAAAARKESSHAVSVVSTVLPGSSVEQLIPALEKGAGRKIGDRLGYCYNPSFIAQGEVMKGLVQPDYVLIGEADAASGDIIGAIHRRMVTNSAPIVRMTPVEAEITKIASNTHETMRVAFANMLLAVCNELPGTNVDRITQALTHRLGKRFFKGAVPYGGPCWPRDNRALAAFMDLLGTPSTLPNTIDRANADHGLYLLRQVLHLAKPGQSVGLVGLAYKPGTPMIERSFGIDLAGWLATEGRKVTGWDPLANSEAARALDGRIHLAARPEECLACDVVVLLLPLAELMQVDWSRASQSCVVDCWRVLSPEQQAAVGRYIALGSKFRTASNGWLKSDEYRERFGLLTS